jgi:type II secretory pathway component GspD/PulD (secretin)
MRLAAVLVLLGLCTPVCAQEGLDKVISYHTREAEIRDIVQSIASLCKVNVMIDPKVRGRMPFNLDNVPAGEALGMLAGITGNKTTLINTVLIFGQEETIKNMQGKGQAVRLRLSYAKAEDVANILNKVYPKDAQAIHYAPTNTVVVSPK